MQIFIKLFSSSILMACILVIGTQPAYPWGEDWKWGKCSKCGQYYKHVGNDISARPGQKVVFKKDGYFQAKLYDGTWKYGIVIKNKPKGETKTWVIWHLGSLSGDLGGNLKGKTIGKVADLSATSDHVHLGERKAPYHGSLSWKGALPRCDHKPNGLPKASEKFISPTNSDISIK